MAYKTQKSDQEWEKIRAQNSVGPAVGGVGHDVAVLVAAGIKPTAENIADVKKWYKKIYNIAEALKKEITTPKPVDLTKAEQLGDKWKKDRIEEERIRIGAKYQEKEEEIPIIEEK